jgi:hypothetical protein
MSSTAVRNVTRPDNRPMGMAAIRRELDRQHGLKLARDRRYREARRRRELAPLVEVLELAGNQGTWRRAAR